MAELRLLQRKKLWEMRRSVANSYQYMHLAAIKAVVNFCKKHKAYPWFKGLLADSCSINNINELVNKLRWKKTTD